MNLVEKLIEVDRVSPKRILVVGDAMTDVYVRGSQAQTCQEGCPKFVEESRVSVPGGAANAARSLRSWRARAVSFGGVGQSTKTRFMCDGRCIYRHDNDNGDEFHQYSVRKKSMAALLSGSEPINAVLLSDYDKGTLTPEFIKTVVALCRDRGIPCVADVKRAPEVYNGCIFKCNEEYGERRPNWWEQCGNFVMTLGDRLPVCRAGGYDTQEVCGSALPLVRCINHVGAGDCFAAHLTLALANGFSLGESAAIAHSAGRVYVQFEHNRPPWPSEIAADMAAIVHN